MAWHFFIMVLFHTDTYRSALVIMRAEFLEPPWIPKIVNSQTCFFLKKCPFKSPFKTHSALASSGGGPQSVGFNTHRLCYPQGFQEWNPYGYWVPTLYCFQVQTHLLKKNYTKDYASNKWRSWHLLVGCSSKWQAKWYCWGRGPVLRKPNPRLVPIIKVC